MGPDYDALRLVFDVMTRDVGELRTQLVAAVDNDPVGAANTIVDMEMNINDVAAMVDAMMLEDRQKLEQQLEQQRHEEQMQQAQLPHCPICYEVCETCRNPVHVECMREYVRIRGENISCPVCRAPRRSEGA
jgi:membrane protease subunit (stomatin/prohibitin family)